ncbi:MAG: hypothetical protein KGJ86_13805 [Chloroflexota bacterium]|nr:hypothetical protein [Chloroflexota bacterium]
MPAPRVRGESVRQSLPPSPTLISLYRLPLALRKAAQARIACLVIPHFALELELLRQPELQGKPVVVGGGQDQPKTVLDCSAEAERWGISIGLPLRQALARCHEAVFVEAHSAMYADVSERMFRAVYDLSPRVEVREPGCLYAGVDGLRPGEDVILTNLADAVCAASGLRPKAAVASGKFPAYAAAVTSDAARVIPAGEVASFVAELACEHLPVPIELRQRLRLFGLRKLRDVAKLPKGALLAQFGRDGGRIWELSIGLDTDFLRAEVPAQQLVEQLHLDDPIASVEALLAGIRTLLHRLATRLRASAQAARSVRLRAQLSANRTWERQVTFKVPVADEDRMLRAAKAAVERTEWQSSVERIEVVLTSLTKATGTQPDLFSVERHGAEQRIDAAIRQLHSRYRRLPLYKVVEADPESRIPERRFALASYLPESQKAQLLPLGQPRLIQVRADANGLPAHILRSNRWQEVTVIREEFRLKDEWWSAAIARRYFRVILANGRYTVIFCERGKWWLAG